jgi:hypothetical protein
VTTIVKPGAVTLAQWRAIYAMEPARLAPSCREKMIAANDAVVRILSRIDIFRQRGLCSIAELPGAS